MKKRGYLFIISLIILFLLTPLILSMSQEGGSLPIDESNCSEKGPNKVRCYSEYAQKMNDSNYCKYIYGGYDQSLCYYRYAKYEMNYSYCFLITGDNHSRDDCFNDISIYYNDSIGCSYIISNFTKSICQEIIASNLGNLSYCNSVLDEKENYRCFSRVANTQEESNICNNIGSDTYKDQCYISYARKYEDSSVCNNLISKENTKKCIGASKEVQTIKEKAMAAKKIRKIAITLLILYFFIVVIVWILLFFKSYRKKLQKLNNALLLFLPLAFFSFISSIFGIYAILIIAYLIITGILAAIFFKFGVIVKISIFIQQLLALLLAIIIYSAYYNHEDLGMGGGMLFILITLVYMGLYTVTLFLQFIFHLVKKEFKKA